MSDSPPGLVGPPVLDGIVLSGGSLMDQDWRRREMRTAVALAHGDVRQGLAFWGAAKPLVKDKFDVVMRYEHLRDIFDVVEDLLAGPGPHELCPWKLIRHQYAGNGARREFEVGRPFALDYYTPPTLLPAAKFATRISIGLDPETAVDLTVLAKTAVDYAGGDPTTGNAWTLEEGLTFKLAVADAPAAGVRVIIRYCPLFTMIAASETSKKYSPARPLFEPRDIELMEM